MSRETILAVDKYLADLRACAATLPPDLQAELLDSIAQHLQEARDAGQLEDEASARNVLDRLGSPSVIVATAAESSDMGHSVSGPSERPRPGRTAKFAVALITVGSLLYFLGWIAGLFLIWTSSDWRRREKLLATLVVPGGPLGAFFVSAWISSRTRVGCSSGVSGVTDGLGGPAITEVVTPESCTNPQLAPWLGVTLIVLVIAASIIAPLVALRNTLRRSGTPPRIA